jgi:hypothetical protein
MGTTAMASGIARNVQKIYENKFKRGVLMILFHCTSNKKFNKYIKTGCILPPVRGWKSIDSAKNWCNRTGRNIILKFECSEAYPLPDHKPRLHAYWTNEMIHEYEIIKRYE